MAREEVSRCVFPLTSLQIGDLKSYLSDLSLFLAFESKKFYILVDNTPWKNFSSTTTQFWQFMVTRSRLSPFANTKGQRQRKVGKEACSDSGNGERKKLETWSALIDAASFSHKKGLIPMEKLQCSLLLSSELKKTLYGFIIFEVEWDHIRGLNYFHELQTDTTLSIEAKLMKRWEFDSVGQALSYASSWFTGTRFEWLMLKESLHASVGDLFYNAEEEIPKSSIIHTDDFLSGGISPRPYTPALKSRRMNRSFSGCLEVDFCNRKQLKTEDLSNSSETAVDSFKDVFISFRFDDHDLPSALKQIVISNLRLLTLLEAGLPSWAIFLQSYPVLCHLYRQSMCPLARALYVIISTVTVVIGFYDLYKNVPILKVTASHLFGPLFDWIETWEMVSRIKYLGTMLFLHNCKKAVRCFVMISRMVRSFFCVLTQPIARPLLEISKFLLPLWSGLSRHGSSAFSVVLMGIGTTCDLVADMVLVLLQPLWLLLQLIWTIGSRVLYPILRAIFELLSLPIRMVLGLANTASIIWTCIYATVLEIWVSIGGVFRIASATNSAVSSTYRVSKLHSLWNDLFSQVFRALRSILYGFSVFFAACNRHRLSIYNHTHVMIQRLLGQTHKPELMGRGYHDSMIRSRNRMKQLSCNW